MEQQPIMGLKKKSSRKLHKNIIEAQKEVAKPDSYQAINFLISSELHADFKIACITKKVSMKEVIIAFIEDFCRES